LKKTEERRQRKEGRFKAVFCRPEGRSDFYLLHLKREAQWKSF